MMAGVWMILLFTFGIVFLLMLIAGITFIAFSLVNYRRNGKVFTAAAKRTLWQGVVFTAIPLLLIAVLTSVVLVKTAVNRNSLYFQADRGTVEGMERLLKKGVPAECIADGRSRNTPAQGTELTILGFVVSRYDSNRNAMMHMHYMHYDKKIQLLIDYGADVNRKMRYPYSTNELETPFLFAVRYRKFDLVALMLENGANVNDRYENGHTALDKVDEDIEYYGGQTPRNENLMKNLERLRKLLINNGAKHRWEL